MKKFLMVIAAVMVIMTAQADEKQLKWKGVAGCQNIIQTMVEDTIKTYYYIWGQEQMVEFVIDYSKGEYEQYRFNFSSVSDARNFRKAIMGMTDSKEEMVKYLKYVQQLLDNNEPIGEEVVIEKAKHPLLWEPVHNSRRCQKAIVEKTPVYYNRYEWDQVVQIGNNGGPVWQYHFLDKGDVNEFRRMMESFDKNITVQELVDFLNSVKNAIRY